MHLVGWLPEGVSDKLISEKGKKYNLNLAPISAYCTKELVRGGLILGYTAFNEKQIIKGIHQLTKVLESVNGV